MCARVKPAHDAASTVGMLPGASAIGHLQIVLSCLPTRAWIPKNAALRDAANWQPAPASGIAIDQMDARVREDRLR